MLMQRYFSYFISRFRSKFEHIFSTPTYKNKKEQDEARRSDASRFFKIENGWILGHLMALQVP